MLRFVMSASLLSPPSLTIKDFIHERLVIMSAAVSPTCARVVIANQTSWKDPRQPLSQLGPQRRRVRHLVQDSQVGECRADLFEHTSRWLEAA